MQATNEQLVNNVNVGLMDLRNAISRKQIPGNKNPDKSVVIVGKTLDFKKQKKSKEIKIFTAQQTLQRLPIALAQVKTGNTFEHLLNEIRQILYSLKL